MKINVTYNDDPKTLEDFADRYHLVMDVRERPLSLQHLGRFIASFEDAEVKSGSVLIGTYGNGNTPEEAIDAYAQEIQGKLLVISAYSPHRKEVWVPGFKPRYRYDATN